jgi:hypothetical protein
MLIVPALLAFTSDSFDVFGQKEPAVRAVAQLRQDPRSSQLNHSADADSEDGSSVSRCK